MPKPQGSLTSTQYEILDALSQRADAMFITLPLEGEPPAVAAEDSTPAPPDAGETKAKP